MDWKVLCLAVTLAGFFCLLKMNVYLHLYYRRRSSADQITVSVYTLYKLISFKRTVPGLDINSCITLQWISKKWRQRKNKRPEAKKWPYQVFSSKCVSRVKCEKFVWKTFCGVGDAGMTAVLTGVLWTIQVEVVRFLQQRMAFAEIPILGVIPVFCREQFTIEFDFLVSASLGNVIIAWLHFLPILNKGVNEHERIANPRTDANSYAKH